MFACIHSASFKLLCLLLLWKTYAPEIHLKRKRKERSRTTLTVSQSIIVPSQDGRNNGKAQREEDGTGKERSFELFGASSTSICPSFLSFPSPIRPLLCLPLLSLPSFSYLSCHLPLSSLFLSLLSLSLLSIFSLPRLSFYSLFLYVEHARLSNNKRALSILNRINVISMTFLTLLVCFLPL